MIDDNTQTTNHKSQTILHSPREIDDAFDYCARITNSHYENFPVASLFLPQEKRPYIQAIYAFARIADDYSDEGEFTVEERMKRLDEWNEQLDLCFQHQCSHPIFIALEDTLHKLHLPKELFADLIIAFKMDVTKNRFENFDELLFYCKHSANPVGRLVLMVFGYRDEEFFKYSDNICTALQLTNFWQDVSDDKKKNRLYLPLDELNRFNYSMEKWSDGVMDNNFRELMKFQVERTKQLFYDGTELLERVDKDLRLELRLVWFGGMKILRKMEKQNYSVFERRPKLNMFDKLSVFWKAMFAKNFYHNPESPARWD
ncbi:MAG: squalene synthase HpnC [Ignavibacteriales bacterium]|nr:squalene synthase HpnC [Ignavibacteriales bacterium]